MWITKEAILEAFKANAKMVLFPLLLIISLVIVFPFPGSASKQEAQAAAFKWAAMLSMDSAQLDCQDLSWPHTQVDCRIVVKNQCTFPRRLLLNCDAHKEHNNGCRLIKILP